MKRLAFSVVLSPEWWRRAKQPPARRCCFCHKAENQVVKLLVSPPGDAAICDECVSVCAFIIAQNCGPESAATSRILEALAP
jgi:hypothetical protein